MHRKKVRIHFILAACLLLLLMLNTQIAAVGAQDGVKLCIQVIIPSLFPFFFLTGYLIPMLTNISFPGFRWLCNKLNIPSGCEGLLILGLIGGYPVGAQAINSAFQAEKLQKAQAHRLMGFCSNAGPAFIFGVTGALFPSPAVPWILWAIHIISALLTGVILPKVQHAHAGSTDSAEITMLQAFRKSLTVTASVCGWVILFKVILSILFHTLHLQNGFAKVILSGLFELSGGCIALNEISSLPLRFLLISALLSFGGICVFMQTASVTAECGTGLYLHGKLIQVLVSTMLSLTLVLLRDVHSFPFGAIISIYLIGTIGITVLRKVCRKKLWKLYCA